LNDRSEKPGVKENRKKGARCAIATMVQREFRRREKRKEDKVRSEISQANKRFEKLR